MQRTLDRLAARCINLPVRFSPRLVLRPWREEDHAPFAAMNADPEVMAHFPAPLSVAESNALIARFRLHAARRGFGMWALEERATKAFVGMVGLWVPDWTADFTPAVEISWRLNRAFWGQGLAFEAAQSALAYGFDDLRLPWILSWTIPANRRSWGLMERLGMRKVETFAHPMLAADHPMSLHVRYRLDSPHLPKVAPVLPVVAPTKLPHVWVDGDGCPRVVKEILWRAAQRGVVAVTLVANRSMEVPRHPQIQTVVVSKGLDVADDWLVAQAKAQDLVITADVPLAAELVPRGVGVLSPRGEWFTSSNIREKLSLRDYFTEARASGMIEGGGGDAPFDERSKRAFANGLDAWLAKKRN